MDIGSELPGWISSISVNVPNAWDNNGIIEKERDTINATLDSLEHEISRNSNTRYPNEVAKLKDIKRHISSCGIESGILGLNQCRRCYVPMLRGLRPPSNPEFNVNAEEETIGDCYQSRTIRDYFPDLGDSSRRGDPRERLIFTGLNLYDDLRKRLLARTKTTRVSRSERAHV